MAAPITTHRFADTLNIVLHGAGAAMMAADLIETHRALQTPGATEGNPIVKASGLVPLKIAGFGAGLALSYAMHKTGHHKAERVIPLILGVPSMIAAAHNSSIH